MCNIRKPPSWRTALPTRPQHPSSQTHGLQTPVLGQGLSDLSQRCHPTPEHTQHTPPQRPEQRRAQASSPQLRAVWHHGLRSHLQPQELLLAAANLQPLQAANIQHGQQAPVSISLLGKTTDTIPAGRFPKVTAPQCTFRCAQPEPSSCICGLGVTSSSPGCFNISIWCLLVSLPTSQCQTPLQESISSPCSKKHPEPPSCRSSDFIPLPVWLQ